MTNKIAGITPAPLSVLFGLVLLSGTAVADEAASGDSFDTVNVIETTNLEDVRGRDGDTNIETNVETHQNLEATVNGGTFNVDTINNGAVNIAEGALQSTGIGVYNITTGNNNAVNASVGVTFNLQ